MRSIIYTYIRTSKLVDFHRRLIVPDGVYATGKKYAYLYGASARLLLYTYYSIVKSVSI